MDRAIKNVNKINRTQKKILVDFMLQHRNLATNNIPNSNEGKSMAYRLWTQLKVKLNAEGPPYKDVKLWRKVFTDQKHQIKKKMSVNKFSEDRLGGGETNLSKEDKQIIEAAGLDMACQKSLPQPPVQSIYTITEIKNEEPIYLSDTMEEQDEAILDHDDHLFGHDGDGGVYDHDDDAIVGDEDTSSVTNTTAPVTTKDSALSLLNDKLKYVLENQDGLNGRLDKLLEINERSLQMKEEEHAANMALKTLELQIKTLELEMLRAKSVVDRMNTL